MFAAVFIPDFFLQAALRHEPDLRSRPIALIDPALPKPNIVQLTAAARARGVAEGLTPSQAMARCAELQIKVRSLSQEQVATDVLLQTAYAFASNIEDTAPGVCTIELKGLGLFGGTSYTSPHSAQTWAEKLIQALAQTNLCAQIGIASTPALALLAARAASEGQVPRVPEMESGFNPNSEVGTALGSGEGFQPARFTDTAGKNVFEANNPAGQAGSPPHYVPQIPASELRFKDGDSCNSSLRIVRNSTEFIFTLPIAALDPTAETASVLERWGIRTVGALLGLGKAALAERLGPEAIQVLDRVSPQASRPLKLVTPKEIFEEQMEFENEIETFEPLLFVLRRFVEQLARRLDAIHLVVAELHLQLKLSSGAVYEHRFHIPVATGNVETLFRTLHTHLESVRTDSPIVALHIAAQPSPPEKHQFGLFETTLKNPNQFAETLARLTALCGSDRVGTPVVESTHRPDVFRMKAPEFDAVGQASSRSQISFRENGDRLEACPTPGLILRRYRPVLEAIIEFRDRRPALVRSSAFNGAIVDVRGPFLSSGDWWDRSPWSREEWNVQAQDGALYRIFRSPEGCFVEGVYD